MSLATDFRDYVSSAAGCGIAAGSFRSGGSTKLAEKCIPVLGATYKVLSGLYNLESVANGTQAPTAQTAQDLQVVGVTLPSNADQIAVQQAAIQHASQIRAMREQVMRQFQQQADAYRVSFEEMEADERMWKLIAFSTGVVTVAGLGAAYYFGSR